MSEQLTPEQILELWQEQYGPLHDRWRSEFLAREETLRLTTYNEQTVRSSFKRHQKLDAALPYAARMSVEPKMKAPPAKEPPRAKAEKKWKTRPKFAAAKRRAGSKQNPIIPSETGGGTGFYNIPTAQQPQKVAGRCGACGAYYGYDGGCLC